MLARYFALIAALAATPVAAQTYYPPLVFGGGVFSAGDGLCLQANPTRPVSCGGVPILATGTVNQVIRGNGTPSANPVLGTTGTTGTLGLSGTTSGTATITPQAVAGTPTLTLPNSSGTFAVSASAPLSLSATTGALTLPGAAGQVLAGATPAFTATPVLGVNATTTGSLGLANGGGSGATVTLQNPSATGAYNYNFPASAGSSGECQKSGGGGSTAQSYGACTQIGQISGTRLANAASGNVAYTGCGFQPKAVVILSGVTTGSLGTSFGFSTGATTNNFAMYNRSAITAGNWGAAGSVVINYVAGVNSEQFAAINSFDADGFTLAWTLNNGGGSPPGDTITFRALCIG